MTQTTERPRLQRPMRTAPQPSGAPALAAAAWALAAGLVAVSLPVLLAWAADSRSGSGAAAALRTAGQVWVVAHGAGLSTPDGPLGLTPLGLVAVPLALLVRAGRHAARTARPATLRTAVELTAVLATAYGVGVAVLAAASAAGAVTPAPLQALLGGVVVGALGGGGGIARESGLWRRPVPARLARLAAAGSTAVLALLGAGAVLAGLSLAVHGERAGLLARATGPGLLGGLVLLLLGVALVPNLAVWGASWWAGPGFAVGVGTSVGPFGTVLGAVPAVPLLAALPASSLPTWLGVLSLVVPLAAGALAGRAVSRRLTGASPGRAAGEAALAGPVAGVALGLLAWLSGGPLGDGRLSAVGPSPWRVGLAVALEVAAAAAATAAARAWLAARAR